MDEKNLYGSALLSCLESVAFSLLPKTLPNISERVWEGSGLRGR